MYLLGRILVVENLDKAVQLAKKYRHQYKLVTLEGDILNPGGAMTGGSQQKKGTACFRQEQRNPQLAGGFADGKPNHCGDARQACACK